MPKFKKKSSPLNRIGLTVLKNAETGRYRIKFANQRGAGWSVRRVASLGIVVLLVAGGFAGYNVAVKFAADQLMKQVAGQMTDEEIKSLIDEADLSALIEETQANVPAQPATTSPEEEKAEPADAEPASTDKAAASTTKPTETSGGSQGLNSKEDAVKFVLGRFSMSELRGLASKANGGLTSEEKKDIKDTLLTRLSEEEFQQLKRLAVAELAKNGGLEGVKAPE